MQDQPPGKIVSGN